MEYIDIHSHLDSEDYNADRHEVLTRMEEEGVGTITIGADFQSSKKAIEIAETNENVWACIGVHPEAVENNSFRSYDATHISLQEFSQPLEELIKNPKVVAIGECGLDYFRLKDNSIKEIQKKLFEFQIEFSIKHDKPLMLHIREAYEDALEILKNYPKARGDVHFFAGSIEIAKKFLDLGFTVSFTGVITFTHDYDEVIRYIPQDSIMSETDAPFVAPVPFRSKRNEPVYVIEVIKKLAEIRGEDFESLNKAILENAKRVFAI